MGLVCVVDNNINQSNTLWGEEMKQFVITLLFVFTISAQSISFGASFSTTKLGVTELVSVDGQIEPGDYKKFQSFLLNFDNLFSYVNGVTLSSPGGDVVEALKFTNLFEKSFASILVGNSCYSSCFIMYSGGAERNLFGMGELGVHRISLREFQPDIKQAKALISPLATDISSYLSQQGIPRSIIDKMNETPASDIYKIDHVSLSDMGLNQAMSYHPVFIDIVDKSCGKNPDPFPGKFINERPALDANTQQLITKWSRCKSKLRKKNLYQFLRGELNLLKSGKQSILFAKEDRQEAIKFLGAVLAGVEHD